MTPIITLGSLVISVGVLMFFMRTCGERLQHRTLIPQGGARPPVDVPPATPAAMITMYGMSLPE
jgi:hypothetical protein